MIGSISSYHYKSRSEYKSPLGHCILLSAHKLHQDAKDEHTRWTEQVFKLLEFFSWPGNAASWAPLFNNYVSTSFDLIFSDAQQNSCTEGYSNKTQGHLSWYMITWRMHIKAEITCTMDVGKMYNACHQQSAL